MPDKYDFVTQLKRNGLKNTRHRIVILTILEQNDQPITAGQIFTEMKRQGININLTTVYRVLDILSEKKLIASLSVEGDGRILYEYNRQIHRHFLICIKCKKILTIRHCPLESYEHALQDETQYKITGHKLDVYGYCPECQALMQADNELAIRKP